MSNKYNLTELKKRASSDLEGIRELLAALKELYHDHDDESWEAGSFLLQHIPQLIQVITEKLTEWFSIDDDFSCYGYLFCSFSDNSIEILEKEFFFKYESGDFEVLNYEILTHFFERGVYDPKTWKSTIESLIKRLQKRLDFLLNNKEISLAEFIAYNKLSIMGFDFYLKDNCIMDEVKFGVWSATNNEEYKGQILKAFDNYIKSLESLILDLEMRD